jgi:hypothetical protein
MHGNLTNEERGLLTHAENLLAQDGRLADDMVIRLRPIMRRAVEAGAVGERLAAHWVFERMVGRVPPSKKHAVNALRAFQVLGRVAAVLPQPDQPRCHFETSETRNRSHAV